MRNLIPAAWQTELQESLLHPRWKELELFLKEEERQGHTVFPPRARIFQALQDLDPGAVRVVILGQDPYHGAGQAVGRSFAVPNSLFPKPPSLRNILKELADDLGITPGTGASDLSGWAGQGVLLLNTVLTVRAESPLSHQGKGWEEFTDSILAALNRQPGRIQFVLWGNHARQKKKRLDQERHGIHESAHPSPLSASRGFFGSRIFSRINRELASRGNTPIDWSRITAT